MKKIEKFREVVKKVSVLNKSVRFALKLSFLRKYLAILEDKIVGIHSLNIGGGPDFRVIGWMNLDEAKGKRNFRSFKLTPDCIFPLSDCSMENVYTSLCLEHLDSLTVNRVIKESIRVLKKDGNFIIKIPDYDLLLNAWRCNDANLFVDSLWSFESYGYTWKNRSVDDCLDYRAAMIF